MVVMMPAERSAWRKSQRERLLLQRRSLSSAERVALARPMLINLKTVLERYRFERLGVYWPIQREIDIRPLADALGLQLALPVVVERNAPLEYWSWNLGDPTQLGFRRIPIPVRRLPVKTDAVVAPLVGFRDFYRLGYGSGYFDRTLAALRPRPFAIGVGFEFGHLEGFSPEPHDMPMDVIVTDKQIRARSLPGETED